MQWTRCASDVHAIIRRGKNEGTVGEWMRWTFFPPFCLSSFLFAQRVHCRFCCRCCTTPPQRGRRVGSRVAPRATALLYVEQPPSPPPLPVVALLSSFLFSSLLFSAPSSLERNNVSRNCITELYSQPACFERRVFLPLDIFPCERNFFRSILNEQVFEGGARSRLNVNPNHPVTCRFRIRSS